MAVTSTNNLKIGSQGDDVLELQKKLNSTGYGYNLDEDGIFGSVTIAQLGFDTHGRCQRIEGNIVGVGKIDGAVE